MRPDRPAPRLPADRAAWRIEVLMSDEDDSTAQQDKALAHTWPELLDSWFGDPAALLCWQPKPGPFNRGNLCLLSVYQRNSRLGFVSCGSLMARRITARIWTR